MANYIQSVAFEKTIYGVLDAKSWLYRNGFKKLTPDETKTYYRFRQEDPARFSRFFTVKPKRGILIIIGVIE